MDLFPFPEIREKQDELMQKVDEKVESGENLVAHAPTGLGKCVCGKTQILTSEGITRIDKLENGESVECNSFDENLVSEKSNGSLTVKKEAPISRIRTSTGREVETTEDHKLIRLKNGEIEWVEMQEIEEGDYIASPRRIDLVNIDFSIDLSNLKQEKIDTMRVRTDPNLDQVLDFDLEDRELEEELNIPRRNFTLIRKNRPVKLTYALKLVENSEKYELSDFEVKEVAYSNNNSIEIPEINENFSYFLGMMIGDGAILGKREVVGFTSQDSEMIELFKQRMQKFGSPIRKVHGHKYAYKSSNKTVSWLLNYLGMPKGKKEGLKIPKCVLTSKENLSSFISGLMDTDGGVDNQLKIEFTTKSKQLSEQLLIAFSVFGIRPIRKEKKVKGETYYRLFISNQRERDLFKERIGFNLDRKQKRLEKTKDFNANKDIIPEISEVIQKARKKSNIAYTRERLRRRLESYEYGSRDPTRQSLQELIDHFEFEESEEIEKIKKLCASDVFWDKVEEKTAEGKQRVYDITSPKNHNFTGNNLILHNTAASVTPALEYAKQNDKKVFFVTPRHSQHQIAIETVREMNKRHDETVHSVDLIGKSHLCEGETGVRGTEGPDCPRHGNTFTDSHELTDLAKEKISEFRGRSLTAEEVREKCSQVCPYQILMHMVSGSDLIVADYFHIFHPGVRDIVLEKSGLELEDIIIIVDEAHNLPSRTRSLFSSSVRMPDLKKAKTEAETFGYYEEERNLEQMQRKIHDIARDKLGQQSHEEKLEKKILKDSINSFTDYEDFIVDLEKLAEEVEEEQEHSYCAGIAEFLDYWNGEDEGFVRTIKRTRGSGGNRYLMINYSCLNPQISTKEPLNKSHSSILMSGTLTPQQMYIDLTGLNSSNTQKASFKSPFPEENELNLIIPTLTTKYEERDDSMYQKYAWYLAKSFKAVDGNCGVFFPSYSMMHTVKELLEQRTDRKLFVEDRAHDKQEKQEMLDEFADRKEDRDSVLLGVAAGSFGEGVDYPGEVLKAVFVVGLPLKTPDLETKELINFYDQLFGKGWDYGYSYPAMNRAMQAAGRCIRSKDDEGVIVYMDKRYDWSNYRKVFPPGKTMKTTKAPWKEIEEFFS